eukprot:3306784-Lingulodinium_polyedra.AAC.1
MTVAVCRLWPGPSSKKKQGRCIQPAPCQRAIGGSKEGRPAALLKGHRVGSHVAMASPPTLSGCDPAP